MERLPRRASRQHCFKTSLSGTLADYRARPGLPALTPPQRSKLRQLSLVSLAKSAAVVPYAAIREALEVQDVREHKDPIEGIKKLLLENGSTEDELKAIDKDIRKTVTQAADFAESSPEPEAGELYTDVLVGEY